MLLRALSRADSSWAPYTPTRQAPWDVRRVVHLHRRAGFAATWHEVRRDRNDGPEVSIARLLAGQAAGPGVPADFDTVSALLADAAVAAGDIGRLKAWWFYRLLYGPDPLGERLTLLWHDHFATANGKVGDPALMRRQNDTLRKHARGRFADLLNAAVREPALLLYLDAPANRKGHPNENLARELMELFTLGVGHYSETDVKEAARALTGWIVEDGRFAESAARHDGGEKTILGQTGKWDGSDLVRILLRQPATAERIAGKLCRLFFGEPGVPPDVVRALAAELRAHDLDVGHAVGVVLKSRRFFADDNLGNRVLGPVEFVVGSVRALELFDPAPCTLALADWAARMGQDLFDPPNVGGWPGGRAWLHTRSLVARANFATGLAAGLKDPTALPKKYGFGTDAAAVLTFHHRLLFGADPPPGIRQAERGKIIPLLLAMPEAQLG
jgi:uncharacterized protein (DUF1800 family)